MKAPGKLDEIIEDNFPAITRRYPVIVTTSFLGILGAGITASAVLSSGAWAFGALVLAVVNMAVTDMIHRHYEAIQRAKDIRAWARRADRVQGR